MSRSPLARSVSMLPLHFARVCDTQVRETMLLDTTHLFLLNSTGWPLNAQEPTWQYLCFPCASGHHDRGEVDIVSISTENPWLWLPSGATGCVVNDNVSISAENPWLWLLRW